MNNSISIVFIIYLLGLLGLGFWASRRTHNLSDYMLGGRTLGSTVTAFSAGASDMSGWLLLGLPGAAYASGEETLKGSLTPIKLADLVVLDRDIFWIAPAEIHETAVIATMVGGEFVYRRPIAWAV